jgi:hypothetical protein
MSPNDACRAPSKTIVRAKKFELAAILAVSWRGWFAQAAATI